MLAAAVGPNLTKLLHDQLDLMFACGLSEPLRQALIAIAHHIPPLLKTIQGKGDLPFCEKCRLKSNADRLLDLLSILLSGQPYKAVGAPPPLVRVDVSIATRDVSSSQVRTKNIV